MLVFGTPTLLILNYNFSQMLSILLPISCLISLLQVVNTLKKIIKIFLKFTKFSIPGIIIFLPISIFFYEQIKIEFLIGLIMISVSALNLVKKFETRITFFIKKYYRIFLVLIGCVHGFTNLGGGLITIFSSVNYSKKRHFIRKAIAVSYLYFVSIQLLLIIFLGKFF